MTPHGALERFRREVAALDDTDPSTVQARLEILRQADGVHDAVWGSTDLDDSRPASAGLSVRSHPVSGGGIEANIHVIGDPGPAVDVLAVAAASLLADRFELLAAKRRVAQAEARAETLASAGQALASKLELPDVFASLLGQLRRVVPYDSASVQVLEGDWLEIIGSHGFPNPEEILGLRFDITAEDNPNREVVERGRPRIMADASELYPTFRRGPHVPASIRGWLGVPLIFAGRTLGMLAIDSRTADFYEQRHARLALAFAAQAAVAIENARMFEEMRRLATHDELTGLPNRRYAEQVAEATLEEARRHGSSVGLLLFDIDRFKDVNDRYGHSVGDQVLRHVARCALAVVRADDVVARFGGEEFVVLLPGTPPDTTNLIGERLRRTIAGSVLDLSQGPISVTISLGSVSRIPDEDSFGTLVRDADRALYRAKASGRDRVVAA